MAKRKEPKDSEAVVGRKWADVVAFMVANPRASNADVIRECGVPERTFYNWYALPEFKSDLDRERRSAFKDRWVNVLDQVYLDAMTAEKASERTAAGKVYLEWSGELHGDGTTLNISEAIHYTFPHQRKEPGANRIKAAVKANGNGNGSNGNGNGNGSH